MMIDTNKPMNAYYFSKNQLKPMIKADDNDIDQILDGVKSRAMDLINAIKAGQFLPGESISSPMHHANQCRVCDYYKVCHSPDRHQR